MMRFKREEAEGINNGAVADFRGEGLDVGEGVVSGFCGDYWRVLVSWGIKMMSSRTKIPRAILLASGV